ncbi:glycosyltransferase [Pseudoxanthomonas gei]|uniref:glycosyltransferase n=1 Tax=Pseudoxanthomonas gei TaxID=1383030 RepID=UPI001FE91DB6|nr:glycosyltransferase [Pseudoxanthomonas gei]
MEEITGPVILTVGTLKAVKNHAFLIEAFSRLPTKLNATLCILGEGQLRSEIEKIVESKGLIGRVLLPGFRTDTTPWYRRADIFVLSSRHEGFGNVIVEALAQGIPVVSTDCPSGPREILCDGKYGRLVPVGDVDAFASAMLAGLKEVSGSEILKERARDFSVGKIADEYLDAMFPHCRARDSA